jgi:hypothetical protein
MSELPASAEGAPAGDPTFAAIERHREAAQALSAAHDPPEALLDELSRTEENALLAWLTTPPTTLAGVIATLEYASHRPYVSDYPNDHVYTNLAESAQYDPGSGNGHNVLAAGEQFPAMIATALSQILAEK